MSGLFGPVGACYALPTRTSDSGPDSTDSNMDSADWLYEARWAARDAINIERSNPEVRRKLKIEQIDRAMDALKNARRMVEEGQ